MPTPRRRPDTPTPARVSSGESGDAVFQICRVIGAGAWGTALAAVAARAGREVVLCARDAAIAARIASTRENPRLPGVRLDAGIEVTADIARAARADIILIATPAQNLRAAVAALAPHLAGATPVIACAKGIERGTHQFMTEVIAEAAPAAHAGDPVGAEFRRRRGARPAHRGDAGGEGRGACERAGAGAGVLDLPALSHHGCSRRRDRGCCEERAGDRGRHRGRPETRRVGAGGADHARLQRTGAARPRLRRAQRDHGGPLGPRRSDPDLLQRAVAQFRARRWRSGAAEPRPTRQARRRRVHRAGADRAGGFAECRYAGIESGRGDTRAARRRSTKRSKAC